MMCFDPDVHHRRSIRLKGYDYAHPGAYFITICTHDRACLFGEIADGEMILNEAGRIVEKCWREIPMHFPHVALDEFVVMPNHVHGILFIIAVVGAKNISPLPLPSESLSPAGAQNIVPPSMPCELSSPVGAKNISPPPFPSESLSPVGAQNIVPPRSPFPSLSPAGAQNIVPPSMPCELSSPVGAKNISPLPSPQRPGTSMTIGSIIRGFKIGVTQWMRQQTPIRDVWQRNYYEHIIRDETALNRIRRYIVENPARWAEDTENPRRQSYHGEAP